jgi:TRAP-type C4-dicarboxylate transport system permease small subunit
LASSDPPPAAPSWLQRIKTFIAWLEDSLLILLLGVMIALATAQIALRDIWESGLVWGDPLTKVLVLWVAMLGAMAATRDGNHINIDLLSRFLPAKARTVNRIITDAFAALVCAVLAYHAARMVIIDHEGASLAFATVPTWVCELIIPIGFAMMGLHFLSGSLLALYQKIRPTP